MEIIDGLAENLRSEQKIQLPPALRADVELMQLPCIGQPGSYTSAMDGGAFLSDAAEADHREGRKWKFDVN